MKGAKNFTEPEMTPEEAVVNALNEQGFLFHHKILDVLRAPSVKKKLKHEWHVEASEVPVALPTGDHETRIDLVLRHGQNENSLWRAVVECKRATKDYKRWVFFGQTEWSAGPGQNQYFFHKAQLVGTWHRNNMPEPPLHHWIERCPSQRNCPVFDYGVEVKLSPPNRDKKSSATEAIESAFNQVTLGVSGLALRLASAHHLTYRIFPIVVTTAELFSLNYSTRWVPIETGMLSPQNIELKPMRWLAVNHRVRDAVSRHPGSSSTKSIDVAVELASKQVRTVFVVQSTRLHEFLAWTENHLPLKQ